LSSLGERVRSPSLNADEQLAIVLRLEEALSRPSEQIAAEHVVRVLLERDDLLHRVAVRLHSLLDKPVVAPQGVRGSAPGRLRLVGGAGAVEARFPDLPRASWWPDLATDLRVALDHYTVDVDGRRVNLQKASLSDTANARFGKSNRPVVCRKFDLLWKDERVATMVVASSGANWLRGLALLVDGHMLHREGEFT
jgi:hypothetical protein